MRSLAHTLGFAHVIAFAALIVASSSALAQTIGVAPAAKSEAQITKPQTEAAVRDLLSKLDDAKVRELLVDEWSKQARERAQALAAKEQRSLPDLLASYGSALSRSLTAHLEGASIVPGVIGSSLSRFSVERGSAPLTSLFGRLLLALGLGSCAAVVFRLATRALESQILSARPETLWRKVGLVVGRLALHLGQISLFFVTGFIVARAGGLGPDFSTIVAILTAAAWVWVAIALSRFVMAPERPELRLCPFDDKTAKFLTFRTALIAALAGGGFGFVSWLAPYRTESIETGSGFWISLALHLLVIVTLYQARHGIADMIRDGEEDNGGTLHRRWFPRIADAWPWISMALVAIQWLALEMVIALGELPLNVLAPALITMGLLISVPILDHGMRTILTSFAPMPETTSARTLAAHYETRRGLVRCSRVILGILLIVGLLRLWGIEVSTLAEQGVGARFAQALIEIALVLLVAYALWELVTIVVGRQIAIERAELATGDGDAHADGEGGKGETRLATVLPLFRLTAHIAIAILATLVIVSELGVNITPLLAGAGIVGLAIGFGAQTLVKDIISGLFFLIDDAFRKGEYIDIGTAKGTVEKISVRSMQLRHHKGPLNTVPFGAIEAVTNFSRDWVVMKFQLRLTYDTNAEKVRKMIKKLGEELLEDPELGPQFLQPLKSQGVVQMEDSAMIMQVKFMTRPGDQWMIRRIVLGRIRDLFEANGVKFASREVTVRLADSTDPKDLTDAERKAVSAAARSIIDAESAETAGAKG